MQHGEIINVAYRAPAAQDCKLATHPKMYNFKRNFFEMLRTVASPGTFGSMTAEKSTFAECVKFGVLHKGGTWTLLPFIKSQTLLRKFPAKEV